MLNRLPSYGCGDNEADQLAFEWAEFLQEMTGSNVVGLHPVIQADIIERTEHAAV